jgi:hypothetical protein
MSGGNDSPCHPIALHAMPSCAIAVVRRVAPLSVPMLGVSAIAARRRAARSVADAAATPPLVRCWHRGEEGRE